MRMAERQWTPAQKNAIEAKSGTILVSAAAGSGKTSVLTERIVRKLTSAENAARPDSLLVVTFTNAAAAEMRSRIYAGISALKAQCPERREEFSALLSVLGEMQVCTMDSFSMNLVKENCHALGIDSDFTMLEQGESRMLKKKAAVSVLERRFTENADTFLALARMFESGRNDARLIETVIRLSDFSMSEAEPDRWLGELYKMYEAESAEKSVWGRIILERVRSELLFCRELYAAAIDDIMTDEEVAGFMLAFFEKEREFVARAIRDFDEASWDGKIQTVFTLLSCISAGRLPSKKGYKENPVKEAVRIKRDTAKELLKKIVKSFNITEAENAQDMEVLRPVVKELCETVREYNSELLSCKKEMSAYDFSDIAHFALTLLYDPQAADKKTPLAREITARLSEILIVEYQDTNRAQDTLFYSISDNGKNMFFVGDVKQSIYRFRLASPEIFIEKCNEFPEYDGKAVKSKIILGHNFRSRKGILDGVNFVFSRLMSCECGDVEYNEDERLNFPEGATPSDTTDVQFTVIDRADEGADEAEAVYIARVIREYLDSGVPVGEGSRARPAVPSDFCILMRSPSGIAPTYIKELERAGIPVSSDVNSSFFETPEIKTVMAYLRVLDNPARDTDMLAVMMSPVFGFSADDVAALRLKSGRRASLLAGVMGGAEDGDQKCRYMLGRLDRFRKLAACASIGEVLREIYDDTSYLLAAAAMKDGERRRKNLLKLLQKAEGAAENAATLGGFVRYMDMLRENGADIAGAGAADGVRIMSMHKSKGLEFPFVFIAGATKLFNKTDINSSLVINHKAGLGIMRKEPEKIKKYETLSSVALKMLNTNELLSEELRVYYVALTRAKQKLFITMAIKKYEEAIREAQGLMQGFKVVPPALVGSSGSAARWLLLAFMLHPENKGLLNLEGDGDDSVKGVRFEFADPFDAAEAPPAEEEKAVADEKTVALIRERAGFTYKWARVSSARSKHTASSIGTEHFDASGFAKSVPAFMFSSSLSPVDVGTATHRFLQFCNFDACRKSVADECASLVAGGRLTEKQAGGVDISAIESFIGSEVFLRIEKSGTVYREKQFTMAKSICELDSSISGEFCDEKTVVIGKIDLLFIEPDGAVIVDYKTDNIKDISVLSLRYRAQMQLYAEALEKSMGLKVKECILYSLRLKDSISLKL